MQFLIIALDGKDDDAPARRQAAREAHLVGVGKLKASGHMLIGGAILDNNGNMVGSSCVVEFDNRELLDGWLDADPYVTGDVWRDITVMPFRVAV